MAHVLIFHNPSMALQKLDEPESAKRVRMRRWGQQGNGTPEPSSSPAHNLNRLRSKSLDSFEDDVLVAECKKLDLMHTYTPSPPTRRKSRKPGDMLDPHTFNLLQLSADTLAAEITCIDLPLFQAIPREELMACKWTSKQKTHSSPKIVAFTQQFNQISFWVMKQILDRPVLKARAEYLAYFIRLAKKLLDLNNINSLVAVVSALQSASIFRLKRTWAEVPKRERSTYQRLQATLSEEDNRKTLRHHMDHMKSPCIPYLGIFLTDLTYLLVAQEKAVPSSTGVFNTKMMCITDQIAKWQMSVYSGIETIPMLRGYLTSVKYLEELTKFMEDELYRTSLGIEPDGPPPPGPSVSLPPSPTSSRPIMSSSSTGSPTGAYHGRGQRKSLAIMQRPELHNQSAACADEGKPRVTEKSKTIGTPKMSAVSHSVQKALGHRRAHSYDHKLVLQGMAGISVIDTQAKPGPRHLIDDSLIPTTGSTSSSSAGDSGICKLSPVATLVEQCVGVEVHLPDTESDAESDSLLDEAVGEHSDLDHTASSMEQVDLQSAALAGTLKRSTCKLSGKLQRSHRWQSYYSVISGNMLAFYSKQPKKRKPSKSAPRDMIDLTECSVADNVLQCKPKRFNMLHKPSNTVFIFKAPSPEAAKKWLVELHAVIDPLMKEVPALLMTFEDDSLNVSGSLSSTEA